MLGIRIWTGPLIQSKITCMRVLASTIFVVAMIWGMSRIPRRLKTDHRVAAGVPS